MSEDINLSVHKKDSVDFDLRLQKARNVRSGKTNNGSVSAAEKGKSKAIRIGTELVAAITVGGGVGLLLDNWLETKPWCLIGFLLLGNTAGLWNIFRITNGHKYKIGFENDKNS